FKLNGQKITANEIDDKLEKSADLEERKAIWEASKESGPALKPNLVVLRDLRNGVAREMKYPDYFSLEVATYGMTTDEMLKMLEGWMATLRPLYLQLHTWAKYKLAEKYHQPVPKKIPAHWINNRWGKEWPGLVEAATINAQTWQQSGTGDLEIPAPYQSYNMRVLVLTGAGVSAESVIPTFRGKDGYWLNVDPGKLATPEAFVNDPELVWEWYRERRQ